MEVTCFVQFKASGERVRGIERKTLNSEGSLVHILSYHDKLNQGSDGLFPFSFFFNFKLYVPFNILITQKN